jgi:hypothetical protein
VAGVPGSRTVALIKISMKDANPAKPAFRTLRFSFA